MAQKHIKKPIEVWLLTGYLGAGKTTALNHLLTGQLFSGRKVALVINEFGKMGVDGQLIEPGSYSKYEINKGSLFCICTKTDFIRIFQQIVHQQFDTVLIEATGIAETVDLEQLLSEPILAGAFRIRANICIVDGINFIKTAAFLKAAVSQVRWADGLIINKTDQLSQERIRQITDILKELNPSAKIMHTQFAEIETDFMDTLSHSRQEGPLLTCSPEEILTAYIATDQTVNKESFYKTIDLLKDHVLRLKGDVGFDSGSCFVEVVGNQVIEKPFCGKFETRTAFTIIGWKIEKQQLKDAFEECITRETVEINK